MRCKIKDIATYSFGYHINEHSNQGIKYLQGKNFNIHGIYLNNVELHINENEITKKHLLKDGDIIFTSKGYKFFAYTIKTEEVQNAIASSIFYVIKVDTDKIIPDYLTCILNSKKSVDYFNNISAGTSIRSIRRQELGDFEFELISLEEQEKIMNIYHTHKSQINILENLIEKKQIRFNQIINEIIN